ncbi:hypothetical protein SAMN05444747_1342 [Variovorax sp. OV329]|nr:hypothetical protein SAMN05444747_1342 [Variovorax sp. OV329]
MQHFVHDGSGGRAETMRGHRLARIAQSSERHVQRVLRHGSFAGSLAREDEFLLPCLGSELLKDVTGLDWQGDPMSRSVELALPRALHSQSGDPPPAGLQVELLPRGEAQFPRPNSHQWEQFQGSPNDRRALVAIDRPQQRCQLGGCRHGRIALRDYGFERSFEPLSRIAPSQAFGNRECKDRVAVLQRPVGCFPHAPGLYAPKDRQHGWRNDLPDGLGPHGREKISLQALENPLRMPRRPILFTRAMPPQRHVLERAGDRLTSGHAPTILARLYLGNPCLLAKVARIDTAGHHRAVLHGFLACSSQAHSRVGPKAQCIAPPSEAVVQTPPMGTSLKKRQEVQALAVADSLVAGFQRPDRSVSTNQILSHSSSLPTCHVALSRGRKAGTPRRIRRALAGYCRSYCTDAWKWLDFVGRIRTMKKPKSVDSLGLLDVPGQTWN